MKLRNLLRGTPAHRPLTPAHPLDEPEAPSVTISFDHKLTPEQVDEMKARFRAAYKPAATASAPDPQCTATTRSGARCKLPRATDSDKCSVHGAKRM